MTFFHDVKKQTNKKPRLFLIFVNKEIFSQIYGEMEIKIFFITSEGIFEWQKYNITIVTSVTCYMKINNAYSICAKEF